MDRGLDSLFFDNSIDEIARSDSESVKNDDGENGISTVRISLIEPDKISRVLSSTRTLLMSLRKISDSMAFCSLYL